MVTSLNLRSRSYRSDHMKGNHKSLSSLVSHSSMWLNCIELLISYNKQSTKILHVTNANCLQTSSTVNTGLVVWSCIMAAKHWNILQKNILYRSEPPPPRDTTSPVHNNHQNMYCTLIKNMHLMPSNPPYYLMVTCYSFVKQSFSTTLD